MQVSGKHIRYTLYVEGVRVPISSLAVRSISGSGASLVVDILPIKEGLLFTKGMVVQLFKQEGTSEPVLKFHGLLKNKVYNKEFGSRQLSLEIGSIDCRWDVMTVVEFGNRNISAGGRISAKEAEKYAADLPNGIRIIPDGSPTNVESHLRSEDTAMVLSGDAIISAGLQVGQGYSNQNLVLAPDIRKTILTEALKGYNMSYSNAITSAIDVAIKKNKGDILAAVIDMIQFIYQSSNPYNWKIEMPRAKLLESLRPLPDTGMGTGLGLLESTTESTTNATRSRPIGKIDAFVKYVDSIVGSARSSMQLKPLILQLLDLIFFKMSVDCTTIDGSLLFHPLMHSYFPPCCNVIFPNMYRALSFNPNSWVEPTRTIMAFPIKAGNGQMATPGNAFSSVSYVAISNHADAFFKDIKSVLNSVPVGANSDISTQVSMQRFAFDIMSQEETMVGATINSRGAGNPLLASLSDSDAEIYADFMHFMARGSVRGCNVTGELLDDLAVGMPILILDYEFSVLGVLEGVSYSVDSNGSVSSQLEIGCPKMIMTIDELPPPPLWLNIEALLPERISGMYEKVYGCGSIYTTDAPGLSPTASSTSQIQACIRYLTDAYESAPDKRIFAEKYRTRNKVTMTDVYTRTYKCTPKKASGSVSDTEVSDVLVWVGNASNTNDTGMDFNAYTLKEADGSTAKHTVVDKQARVLDYVKAYYNKPGLIAK